MIVIKNGKDPKREKKLDTKRARRQIERHVSRSKEVGYFAGYTENGIPFYIDSDGKQKYYPEGFDKDGEAHEMKEYYLKKKYNIGRSYNG